MFLCQSTNLRTSCDKKSDNDSQSTQHEETVRFSYMALEFNETVDNWQRLFSFRVIELRRRGAYEASSSSSKFAYFVLPNRKLVGKYCLRSVTCQTVINLVRKIPA